MTTSKEVRALERARLGLLHVLAILDAAERLTITDIADLECLVGAARDLCGRHLEEADGSIGALKAGGGA